MDTKETVVSIITYTLLAVAVVLLGTALWFAYVLATMPTPREGEPILLGFPVKVPVKEVLIVATSSENLPAVGTTTN
jgi:hypothetical protein